MNLFLSVISKFIYELKHLWQHLFIDLTWLIYGTNNAHMRIIAFFVR